MKGWDELGVVDTIYEEEEERDPDASRSLSLTPSITASPTSPRSTSSLLSPSPTSLNARVEEWSKMTGRKTDIIIRLHDHCFFLHKDPLISRSRYLCRRLTESTEITINPPSKITAETFSEIILFCYDSSINLTPSNVAAVRIAADWLEMDVHNGEGNGSLTWVTEIYFRQEIAGDGTNAEQVLRTCVQLLPDVTAALLAVRCVEVLASEGGDGEWIEELTALPVEVFRGVAESMRTWFVHDHDLLYRIVDYYLENHRESLLTEEQKIQLCHSINPAKLSQHLLLHLVQNPRLPLRFIIQSILLDHLHTRHSLLHLSEPPPSTSKPPSTLGAILQRDAILRNSSHLRSSIQATSFRIESLERDLDGLRRKLRWSEEKGSSSFRVVGDDGARGGCVESGRRGKGIGRKLLDGFKSVFKTLPSSAAEVATAQRHRRNNSFA